MAGLDDQPNIKPEFDGKCSLTETERLNIVDRQTVLGAGAGAAAGAVVGLGVPGALVGLVAGDVFGHRLGEQMASEQQSLLEQKPGCQPPKPPGM